MNRIVEALLEGRMAYVPGGVPSGTSCYYEHSGRDVPATHHADMDNRGTKSYACKMHADLWNAGKPFPGPYVQPTRPGFPGSPHSK